MLSKEFSQSTAIPLKTFVLIMKNETIFLDYARKEKRVEIFIIFKLPLPFKELHKIAL